MKLLIIEDDVNLVATLRDGLVAAQHVVDVATNGADGLFMAKSFDFDAIILDYSLPKKDGLEVCRSIRAAGKMSPIIFLSMTDDPSVKVQALDSGADDYMTKPFVLEELYARLRAISRRPAPIKDHVLTLENLVIDTEKNIATRGNERIRLTRKEFCLLEYFLNHVGTVISRATLMEQVWTADSNPFSNTVEAHIRNLRKKLNFNDQPDLIANIAGRGYVMDSPVNLAQFR